MTLSQSVPPIQVKIKSFLNLNTSKHSEGNHLTKTLTTLGRQILLFIP